MRIYFILFIGAMFISLSITCSKQKVICGVENIEQTQGISGDSITQIRTFRGDVPAPPNFSWWTINEDSLNDCQQIVWNYLKYMYPIEEEDYWNYRTFSIANEPEDGLENRDFLHQYIYFFSDTLRTKILNNPLFDCEKIDSTFFLNTLGVPTCKSYNIFVNQVNYFYAFKLSYRHGPCPYIFDEGDQWEQYCFPDHFMYCAFLKVIFSQDTGRAVYIHFFGPG